MAVGTPSYTNHAFRKPFSSSPQRHRLLSIHINAILCVIEFSFIIMVLHHKNKAYNIICDIHQQTKRGQGQYECTIDKHRFSGRLP